ncbi:SDR family oxidoreductase [Bradyrhizobium yuanmingense]|uniref:SDR family oxidoreductase n=1 Tax=Bradyrhizobium yuanmingense TaxID=108015 RepID=UPI0021A2CF98|nr:SDR family oxidoreductase [Bradyrhizobium sp. CB1024]UWU83213.1 SDR family oxidoreductase [Bradyrhizobium sp. CB1024]
MKRLTNKRAIVTGAAQGIGLAIARSFVAEGACVALVDINARRGHEATEELANLGAEVCFIEVDVADSKAVDAMMAEAAKRLGPPNVLVNNAGVAVFRDPLEMAVEDWRHCFTIDLDGAWHCSRAVLPHLLKHGQGDIINIASVHASQIIPKCFPYPVAKHAVVGLTRALAIEYADRGIRVNAISPGYIGTEIVENVFASASDPEKLREETNALHPVKRIGRPEEVACTAVFLASDEARFLTAQNIVIDGGRSILFHQ